MALDSVARWQMVHDVIVHKKSGTIVVQTGTNYLNWIVEGGDLVCVSSTFPETSLTQWIADRNAFTPDVVLNAQNDIDASRTLGSILIRHRHLDQEKLGEFLFQHWVFCTSHLFDPAAHVFWSGNPVTLKTEFIRCDRSFSEVLLSASRDSISIPTALRVIQDLKLPYRVQSIQPDQSRFNEEEKRIWMHLKSGNSLKQMLHDPEITRIPCYKLIFLLWLGGYIADSRKELQPKPLIVTSKTFLEKIPPEWIIPLCAGTLIGVLLAPASTAPSPPPAAQEQGIEPLEESVKRPAWSPEEEKELNTETQRHRDHDDK